MTNCLVGEPQILWKLIWSQWIGWVTKTHSQVVLVDLKVCFFFELRICKTSLCSCFCHWYFQFMVWVNPRKRIENWLRLASTQTNRTTLSGYCIVTTLVSLAFISVRHTSSHKITELKQLGPRAVLWCELLELLARALISKLLKCEWTASNQSKTYSFFYILRNASTERVLVIAQMPRLVENEGRKYFFSIQTMERICWVTGRRTSCLNWNNFKPIWFWKVGADYFRQKSSNVG